MDNALAIPDSYPPEFTVQVDPYSLKNYSEVQAATEGIKALIKEAKRRGYEYLYERKAMDHADYFHFRKLLP